MGLERRYRAEHDHLRGGTRRDRARASVCQLAHAARNFVQRVERAVVAPQLRR